jgi:hypothetical protein
MMPPAMRSSPALLLLCGCLALTAAPLSAQPPPTAAIAENTGARSLQAFEARYEAHYRGKPAGSARLDLTGAATRWEVTLEIEARAGIAGILGLDLQQTTDFETLADGGYRPLTQRTERKGLLLGRETSGRYDWARSRAQWTGDLKKRHRAPVALQPGDMSGLLINLAIVRDARPGAVLRYRFVEGGRVREHVYAAADAPEQVEIGGLRYTVLRVARSNGGNDDTVVWVAEGVPTPVRILQREDGEDAVDLRLIEYR